MITNVLVNGSGPLDGKVSNGNYTIPEILSLYKDELESYNLAWGTSLSATWSDERPSTWLEFLSACLTYLNTSSYLIEASSNQNSGYISKSQVISLEGKLDSSTVTTVINDTHDEVPTSKAVRDKLISGYMPLTFQNSISIHSINIGNDEGEWTFGSNGDFTVSGGLLPYSNWLTISPTTKSYIFNQLDGLSPSGRGYNIGSLRIDTLTNDRNWTLPNSTGTLALKEQSLQLVSNSTQDVVIDASTYRFHSSGMIEIIGSLGTSVLLNSATGFTFVNTSLIGPDMGTSSNLIWNAVTASRNWNLPDASGTLALTSQLPDVSNFLPKTFNTAQTLTYTSSGTFTFGALAEFSFKRTDNLGFNFSPTNRRIELQNNGGYTRTLQFSNTNSSSYTFTFRDISGTIALTSDLSSYQPLDADLTSIAGLSGTYGLLRKTANNSWSLDTTSYEPILPSSDVSTYLRGDKSWQTLDTSIVPENGNLYFTDTRADARISAQKGIANGLATLDSNSKIPSSQLPSIAVTDTFVVSSETQMLSLVAERGDVAIRTDLNKSFILTNESPSIIGSWQELLTPTDSVLSVNGQTGIVNLTTSNITEGTNLYFTESRAIASPLTGYTVGTNTSITATDSILQAFGKTQAQINAKENSITSGTNLQYLRGDKTWQTLNTANVPELGNLYYTNSRANTATLGTPTITNIAIAQNDTFLTAFGKLQGQINNKANSSELSSYLLLSGGTLTGTLNGTSATFSGLVSASTAPTLGQNLTNKTYVDGLISSLSTTYQPLDDDLTSIAGLIGTSGLLRKTATNTWSLDTNAYLTDNQTITLSGEVTGSGTTSISTTVSNSAVINKVLTGFNSTIGGTIQQTDTILQGLEKLEYKSNNIVATSDIDYLGYSELGIVSIGNASYLNDTFILTNIEIIGLVDSPSTSSKRTKKISSISSITLSIPNGIFNASTPYATVYIFNGINQSWTDSTNITQLYVQSGSLTPEDRRFKMPICILTSQDLTNISGITWNTQFVTNSSKLFKDFLDVVGNPKNGLNLSGSATNLNLNISNGSIFGIGYNTDNGYNYTNTNDVITFDALAPSTFYLATISQISNVNHQSIPVHQYNNINDTLLDISANHWVNHRVFCVHDHNSPNTNGLLLIIQYGQNIYQHKSDALTAISTENFILNQATARMTFLGVITIQHNEILSNNATFTQAGHFGDLSSSSSGGSFVGVSDTNSINLNEIGGIITADIKISPDVGNTLVINSNGLYTPRELPLLGNSSQYLRGDSTWQILDTSNVLENGNLYFTDTRARNTIIGELTIVNSPITSTDSINTAFGEAQGQINAINTSLSNYLPKSFSTSQSLSYTGDITDQGAFVFGSAGSIFTYETQTGKTFGINPRLATITFANLSAGNDKNLIFPTSGAYNYTLPSTSGTIALTTDLNNYVQKTSATSQTINITGDSEFRFGSGGTFYVQNSNITADRITLDALNRAIYVGNNTLDFYGISLRTWSLPDASGTIALTNQILPTTLSGFTVGDALTITSSDTILSAFGRAQGQINALYAVQGDYVQKNGDTMTGSLQIDALASFYRSNRPDDNTIDRTHFYATRGNGSGQAYSINTQSATTNNVTRVIHNLDNVNVIDFSTTDLVLGANTTIQGGLTIQTPYGDGSSLIIPNGSWIRPSTLNGDLYITRGTNPSSVNGVLQLNSGGIVLSHGDGTNQLDRLDLGTANARLASFSATGVLLDFLQLGNNNISLVNNAGVGLNATSTMMSMFGSTFQLSAGAGDGAYMATGNHLWDSGIANSTAKYQFNGGDAQFNGSVKIDAASSFYRTNRPEATVETTHLYATRGDGSGQAYSINSFSSSTNNLTRIVHDMDGVDVFDFTKTALTIGVPTTINTSTAQGLTINSSASGSQIKFVSSDTTDGWRNGISSDVAADYIIVNDTLSQVPLRILRSNSQIQLPLVSAGTIAANSYLGLDASGNLVKAASSGGGAVSSVFGRIGDVVAQNGDYTTTQVTEGTNLYFTDVRVRNTTLSGLSIVNSPITSTDNIITAFGEAQGQIDAINTSLTNYLPKSFASSQSLSYTGAIGDQGSFVFGSAGSIFTYENQSGKTFGINPRLATITFANLSAGNDKNLIFPASGAFDYTLPSTSGTIALTSQIPDMANYLPTSFATSQLLNFTGTNPSQFRFQGNGNFITTDITSGLSISLATEQLSIFFGSNRLFGGNGGSNVYTLPNATGTIALTSQIPSIPVISVFGRTGAIVAQNGDYTTTQVTEGTNLYFTEARVRSALLTGFSATNSAIVATDSVLVGFNKTQGQINSINSTISGLSSVYQPLDADLTSIAGLSGTSGLLRKTATDTWSLDTNTYLTSNQTITLSGEVTGSGTTSISTTVSNSAVTGKVLTGFSVGTNTALLATDTILQAFGNTQAQINAKENSITSGTTSQYWRGDKSWQTLDTTIVSEGTNLYFTQARAIASPLTGFSTGTNTAIVATDTVLQAFGKTQAQLNAKANTTDLSNYLLLTGGTLTGDIGITSSATTGQPSFITATTSAGAALALRYTETTVGSVPADVYQFRMGGADGNRNIVWSYFDNAPVLTIASTGLTIPNLASTSANITNLTVSSGINATNIPSGTIVSGGNLGLDASGNVVKATVSGGSGSSYLRGSLTVSDNAWSGNTDYTYVTTISGATIGSPVIVSPDTNIANVIFANTLTMYAWVSAANQVSVRVRVATWVPLPATRTLRLGVLI